MPSDGDRRESVSERSSFTKRKGLTTARDESLTQDRDLVRLDVSALRTITHTRYSSNHHIHFPLALAKVAASDLQNDPALRTCGAIDTHSFNIRSMSDDVRPLTVRAAVSLKLCSEHRVCAGCGVTLGRRCQFTPDDPANQRPQKLGRWYMRHICSVLVDGDISLWYPSLETSFLT